MSCFVKSVKLANALIPKCMTMCSPGVRNIHRSVRPIRHVFTSRKRQQELRRTTPLPVTPRYAYSDWNYDSELSALGARIGEMFTDDILRIALTDSSYVAKQEELQKELSLDPASLNIKDNEQLAKQGNEIIRKALNRFVRFNFPDLPAMGIESICAFLTSEPQLAQLALGIGCKDLILTNEYPPSEATLAKAFKAIVAAIEQSHSNDGLPVPRSVLFVTDFVASQLCNKDINEILNISHPWKMLNEMRQHKGLGELEPRLIREAGRNTILSAYVVGLYEADKTLVGTGIGETVDIAHEMAARDALSGLFGTRKRKLLFDSVHLVD